MKYNSVKELQYKLQLIEKVFFRKKSNLELESACDGESSTPLGKLFQWLITITDTNMLLISISFFRLQLPAIRSSYAFVCQMKEPSAIRNLLYTGIRSPLSFPSDKLDKFISLSGINSPEAQPQGTQGTLYLSHELKTIGEPTAWFVKVFSYLLMQVKTTRIFKSTWLCVRPSLVYDMQEARLDDHSGPFYTEYILLHATKLEAFQSEIQGGSILYRLKLMVSQERPKGRGNLDSKLQPHWPSRE